MGLIVMSLVKHLDYRKHVAMEVKLNGPIVHVLPREISLSS